MNRGELPVIRVEVKDAASLKPGLKDIKGNLLPEKGIVIKRVKHSSPDPVIEYIVPEGNSYYAYLTEKIKSVDMTDFLEKCKK